MNKKTNNKIKVVTIKTFKILVVLLIIVSIYSMGRVRGIIDGIYVAQSKHNETVCDIMNKTRDIDGFCLLSDKEYKYRYYLDCGWEKFKIKGERKPPFLISVAEDIRGVLYYPIIGC